jgi:DNA uptake protein ComE-like DNA-binding protein
MDINRATKEQLEEAFQLDGQRAEYLVLTRQQLGGFKSWDQIKDEVPSFEDKMVANLQAAGLTLGGQRYQRKPRDGGGGRNGLRDLNEASAAELEQAFQLDGQRAEYLVQKRQQLGGFKSWDQIKDEVPSFEEKMVEHLREAGFTLGKADAA